MMRQKGRAKPSDPRLLSDVLDAYRKDDNIFVHVGLSQIKAAFDENPYDFLMKRLRQHFSGIITPGFTPSFRQTGLYHKLYSVPEYGKFSALFLKDATFRTDDPIHSLLAYGNYRFENSYTREAFGRGSSFDQLDRDNILCLSIGTRWPVSSQKHFIEYRNQLPYVEKAIFDGIIYYDKSHHEKITTINYYRKHWFNKYVTLLWNNYKIARQMEKSGVMESWNVGGVMIYAFRMQEMRVFLEEKFKKDPYYLFT